MAYVVEITRGGNIEIDNVKNIEKIEDVAGWKPPVYNDQGIIQESIWWQIASIAVATLNTLAMMDIAKKEYQLAKDYANLATEKWERFKKIYLPCEQKTILAACNTPPYEKQYEPTGNAFAALMNRPYNMDSSNVADLAKRYYLCIDDSLLNDMALMQAGAALDATNFGYRYEEARKDAMDDRRWNRRAQLLNLGRNIEADAMRYADMAQKTMADRSNTIKGAAQGAMTALGYFRNRRETDYPQMGWNAGYGDPYGWGNPNLGGNQQMAAGNNFDSNYNFLGGDPLNYYSGRTYTANNLYGPDAFNTTYLGPNSATIQGTANSAYGNPNYNFQTSTMPTDSGVLNMVNMPSYFGGM